MIDQVSLKEFRSLTERHVQQNVRVQQLEKKVAMIERALETLLLSQPPLYR